MRRLLLLLALVAFPGCFIRSARMESKLKPWVGRSIHEAVSEFGPPTSAMPNGDRAVVTWAYTGESHAVANAFGNQYGANAIGSTWTDQCSIWFDVDAQAKIVGWHWRGQC